MPSLRLILSLSDVNRRMIRVEWRLLPVISRFYQWKACFITRLSVPYLVQLSPALRQPFIVLGLTKLL